MSNPWTDERRRDYFREYYKNRRAKCKEEGICVSCIKVPAVEGKSSCQQCLDDKKLCSKFGKSGPYRQLYADLFEKQGGCCAICKTVMTRPVLDHCHVTMEVRGLLCSKCNVGIGQFNDDPALLVLAINYLNNAENSRTGVMLKRNRS